MLEGVDFEVPQMPVPALLLSDLSLSLTPLSLCFLFGQVWTMVIPAPWFQRLKRVDKVQLLSSRSHILAGGDEHRPGLLKS